MISKLKDIHPALGDTAVNLYTFDPAWYKYISLIDMLVMQSATHWPKAETWLRRFFVDRQWKLLDPQPDSMTAYT